MPETQNILDTGAVTTILKWAVMILVTGFIAHFGKKFAEFIIERIGNIRKKKAGGMQEANVAVPTPAGEGDADARARVKLEKKLAKAAAKERKKRG